MRSWKLLAAMAAVMLVLAACAGTVETTMTEAVEWADTPEGQAAIAEAIELGEAYIGARNAYDVERARELVSADFRTEEPPDGFVDRTGMELAFEQHRAYGFHYSDVDCAFSARTSDGVAVACAYLWTTELHRIGDDPPTPERLTFIIDDGQIQRIMRGRGAIPAWSAFFDRFLSSEHPEFRGVVSRSLRLDPEAARELVERLPEYFDLFEEWLGSEE